MFYACFYIFNAYIMHISAYVFIFLFTYSCMFLHLMCIFCAYGYLYLHINCISLHILLHINAYCYLFITYFCIFYSCSYIFVAYIMHISAYVCIFLFTYSCIFSHFCAYFLHMVTYTYI